MVGDINLFLKGTPPHLRGNTRHTSIQNITEDQEVDDFEAELEIMIASARNAQNIAWQ